MKKDEERKCCKADSSWSKINFEGDYKTNSTFNLFLRLLLVIMKKTYFFLELDCISHHDLLSKLLDPVVLEIMLDGK